MNQFDFHLGQWYNFYYVDGSTRVAKFITSPMGIPVFQTEDGSILSYSEIIKNCCKIKPHGTINNLL